MKITRLFNGHKIELFIEKIKDYPRHSLYQVYKLVNDVKVPVYQESFTNFELYEIAKNGYKIYGEW